MASSQRRIAVVGAGVAGLSAIKACLDEGIEPLCFERQTNLGGLWNYSEEHRADDGPVVYDSLVTNTSKWMTSFSDFPFPADCPPYFSYKQFYDYLQMYAKHFNLIKCIRFNTKVLSITKADDYDDTGRWNVKTECSGNIRTDLFDYVIVGLGFYRIPFIPTLKGMDGFTGTKEHSNEYTSHHKYKNKRILVIGNGNSAGDIAVDVSHVAKQVYLSVGSGCWIVAKHDEGGKPLDYSLRRIFSYVPYSLINLVFRRKCNAIIDHTAYAIRPNTPPLDSTFMANDEIAWKLICGKITIAGAVNGFGEKEAMCEDGTVIEDLDCVIFATGYKKDLSIISPSIHDVSSGKVECYKMIFPLQLCHDTLALIGCLGTFGSLPPVFEIQSRLVARVFAGKLQLPDKSIMEKEVEILNKDVLQRFGRYLYRFQNVGYRDEIATVLGIKPTFRHFITNPKLTLEYYLGTSFPVHHRFIGEGALDNALDICKQATNDTTAKQLRKIPPDTTGHRSFVLIFGVMGVGMAMALFML